MYSSASVALPTASSGSGRVSCGASTSAMITLLASGAASACVPASSSGEDVVIRVDHASELPVLVDRPGRQGVHLAGRVLVVAVGDRRVGPHELADLAL